MCATRAHTPWQSQCVSHNPKVSPPALHNARYAGWPHPPIQLPHVGVASGDTPSLRPQVNVFHTEPYHIYPPYETFRSRINYGAQASANITGPVNPQYRNNSRTWNGDARAPFTQGTVDAHTTTRHDTGNTQLIYGHSVPRTMPSNVNEPKEAYPHPLLSALSTTLTYDLRLPPTSLWFPSSSPYAGCGYELLFVPLTPERPRQIRLISPDFPWAFDIGPDPSAGEEGVTCLDVLATLHDGLQRPLTDTEWGTARDDRRARLIRARDRRQMGLQGSSESASLPARSVSGANASDNRLVQQEPLLLRVDWLGSRVALVGLIKDEAFARSRLIPGGGQPPETWVVKFKRL